MCESEIMYLSKHMDGERCRLGYRRWKVAVKIKGRIKGLLISFFFSHAVAISLTYLVLLEETLLQCPSICLDFLSYKEHGNKLYAVYHTIPHHDHALVATVLLISLHGSWNSAVPWPCCTITPVPLIIISRKWFLQVRSMFYF